MVRLRWLLLVLLVFVCAGAAAEDPARPSVPVTLGASTVPLYGPWKFSVGDSPLDAATGRPLWAEPDFDDTHWEDVDLTPADGSYDPGSGVSGYTPG